MPAIALLRKEEKIYTFVISFSLYGLSSFALNYDTRNGGISFSYLILQIIRNGDVYQNNVVFILL